MTADAPAGSVTLVDGRDVADLGTFLARARRVGATAVRLQANGRVLAVTVCALEGHGLLGEGTVLGMRAMELAEDAACDVVVAVDAVHDRLARMRGRVDEVSGRGGQDAGPPRLVLPPVPVVVSWAGLAPPRSGWEPVGVIAGSFVDEVATQGIAEVTASTAADLRDVVWNRPIPGTDLPAGVALAVHALGFSAPELTVFTQGRWSRLSGPAGHVLAR